MTVINGITNYKLESDMQKDQRLEFFMKFNPTYDQMLFFMNACELKENIIINLRAKVCDREIINPCVLEISYVYEKK